MQDKIIKLVDGFLDKTNWLSFTSFQYFRKSPAHFVHYKTRVREPEEFLNLGSLAHVVFSEPEKLANYVVFKKSDCPFPQSNMNKKENKIYKQQLIRECLDNNKVLIKETDLETAKQMAESMYKNKEISGILNACDRTEQRLDFEWEGLRHVGYEDRGCEDLTVDFKTTNDASFHAFRRMIGTKKYHEQGVTYNIGNGALKRPYFIIAIETKPPYGVSVHYLTDATLEKAYQNLLERMYHFKRCLASPELFELSCGFWAKEDGIFQTTISY